MPLVYDEWIMFKRENEHTFFLKLCVEPFFCRVVAGTRVSWVHSMSHELGWDSHRKEFLLQLRRAVWPWENYWSTLSFSVLAPVSWSWPKFFKLKNTGENRIIFVSFKCITTSPKFTDITIASTLPLENLVKQSKTIKFFLELWHLLFYRNVFSLLPCLESHFHQQLLVAKILTLTWWAILYWLEQIFFSGNKHMVGYGRLVHRIWFHLPF